MKEQKCRFLSPDGLCRIGEITKPSKSALQTEDVVNFGGLSWTSTVTSKSKNVCLAAESLPEQASCDCFVPEKKIDRAAWLADFQEG